ncbi:hypothetical protein GCM10020331_011430 [Ectobacillus funiculus]
MIECIFDVPIYEEGDVLARVRVRIEEVFQSVSIVQQVLEQLPTGNIVTSIPELQPYQWAMGWAESPRGETVHWLMTGQKSDCISLSDPFGNVQQLACCSAGGEGKYRP